MIFFRSISGSWIVFSWDSNNFIPVDPTVTNEINLDFSYKWASYGLLQWNIKYFQDTQIVDY
jgi:hypothetical protein